MTQTLSEKFIVPGDMVTVGYGLALMLEPYKFEGTSGQLIEAGEVAIVIAAYASDEHYTWYMIMTSRGKKFGWISGMWLRTLNDIYC